MCCDDVAIKVTGVSKVYELYDKPWHRLLQCLCMGRSRFYKEFTALDNVSFELKRGHCLGIIGRNGSGKSTLLQIIAGTLAPSGGSVEINGKVAALLELGSGFNPEFTGRENIFMNAALYGMNQAEISAKLDKIIEFAGIGDFIDQPVKTYSSGMAVRLAFSVIAHVDADILIIDEALAVGDAFFVQKCMAFLHRFIKEKTVLFVSHDTGAVSNLCDTAIMLDRGHISHMGDPKSVTEKYLESFYESYQAEVKINPFKDDSTVTENREIQSGHDTVNDIINISDLRNSLQIFDFDADSDCFGKGELKISDVALLDEQGRRLLWVVGGERVVLRIHCQCFKAVARPIAGFYLKDCLGQNLFGDNTFSSYPELELKKGQSFSSEFSFIMPRLPVGEYTINPAVAEGTLEKHVQQHWIHNALTIRSHSSAVCQGLVGIPMERIRMYVNE